MMEQRKITAILSLPEMNAFKKSAPQDKTLKDRMLF